jgi:hypothetical protein
VRVYGVCNVWVCELWVLYCVGVWVLQRVGVCVCIVCVEVRM